MDVDDPLRIPVYEVVRQDLHIASEHHEIRLMFGDERVDLSLGRALSVFRDRNYRVWNLVKVSDRLVVGVIGNDQRNVARPIRHSGADTADRPGNDRISKPG